MLSFVLIALASLFFTGVIIRTKSITAGRKGPGIMQPVKDVIRLMKKGAVYSQTTSIVFRLAPVVYFCTVAMAALLIPFGSSRGVISFNGDFIFFAYLLGLGKFFNIIAAMDTGSSFEGMGASREALYSLFAEPAFFIILGSYITYALAVLAALVLAMIAMIENSRLPIDDPKTHLELTMVHEVMILDNSGFDLGLILYAGYLKFAIFGAIIANLFTGGMSLLWALVVFVGTQFSFAVVIGLIESFMARFRMNHNAQFIFALSSVSFLIFLGVLLVLGKFI
ncbi:MAG TPA: NADH-quinone oxidoreductase subunit H [Williamwhitmania sp.]|nr:NADH-quinone oxidoreductase subunit H [Williamwhitmania sp.]